MTTIEAPHKFVYVGDPTDLSVMTVGVSSKDLYYANDMKHNDIGMTEREKRGSLKITMIIDDEEHSLWITKFSKIDKPSGIQIRFKRGLL